MKKLVVAANELIFFLRSQQGFDGHPESHNSPIELYHSTHQVSPKTRPFMCEMFQSTQTWRLVWKMDEEIPYHQKPHDWL